MPAPSERIRAAALHAQLELADERTPFVFDSWYVAALAEEISRRPLARRILGLPLVLFRREDGRAVALVRDFALIESGRLVWIWMGEAEAADPALLPQQDWMNDPAWVSSTERMHLEASYVRLHENLLDLTHLSFLHAKTFGTPDYASAAFETRIDEAAGRFSLLRSVVPTRLPPIWGRPTGLEGRDAARIAESTFHWAFRNECDAACQEFRSRALVNKGHTQLMGHIVLRRSRRSASVNPAANSADFDGPSTTTGVRFDRAFSSDSAPAAATDRCRLGRTSDASGT